MEENGNLTPSALDSLDPGNFKTEAQYLEAAAELELKRSSPEFQRAFQRVGAEYARRADEKKIQERAAALESEVKKTRLSESEDKAALQKASEEVSAAVSRGNIETQDMQEEIEKRYRLFVKQQTRRKAQNKLMNSAIRESCGLHPSAQDGKK